MFRNLVIFLYCVQDFLIISPYYSVTNEGAFSLQAVSNFLILYRGDRYISQCDLREEQHKELLLVCCRTLKCLESNLQALGKWGALGLPVSPRSLFLLSWTRKGDQPALCIRKKNPKLNESKHTEDLGVPEDFHKIQISYCKNMKEYMKSPALDHIFWELTGTEKMSSYICSCSF